MSPQKYNPAVIEPKWQKYWDENKTFRAPEMPTSEKLYVLDMFPYPSGNGLHVGHPEGYTATDIVCRHARMKGKSVLHPMGFDAFGLPAEEYAILTNTPPRQSTEENIATFTRQLKMLGFSYDWDRVLATTDVAYFRWTQWIFTVLYDTWYDGEQGTGRAIAELPIPPAVVSEGETAVAEYQDDHRLAYQADALVNWCPKLGTVLANEEVQGGRSERGGYPVQRMPLRQWMLRITAYGDRLEEDLKTVNWSAGIKKLQQDWIGRSTGAEVDFFIGDPAKLDAWKTARAASCFPRKPADDVLRIYTTRPDTLYGATYMVIAPEHPFVGRLTSAEQAAVVTEYCENAASKSDRERQEDKKEKTGVFTGSYALNPVNGEPVPIWIADYVLISYGTGAIMAVPAHDVRDFEFAKQYDIPIIPVVDPGNADNRDELMAGTACFAGHGKAINSAEYDGLSTVEFKAKISESLTDSGQGREAVNFKLRDWLFSRQRFWGEPFPVLHEVDAAGNLTGMKRTVDPADLPVDLPHLDDYKPHGRPEPPLAKAGDEWLYVELDGKRYRRETNTMPQWAGSCWYYLRFIDPTNSEVFVDAEKEKAWMPIDLYVGGAEHAVLHLLYARFWHKVLFDRGHVSTAEPFQKLVNQGMILGETEYTAYTDGDTYYSANDVEDTPEGPQCKKSLKFLDAKSVEIDVLSKVGNDFVLKEDPSIRVDSRAHKMSKSRGNVVNPDVVVDEYGADSLRLYEMFMGPLEATKPWSMQGVKGVNGFLNRVWRLLVDENAEDLKLNPAVKDVDPNDEALRVLHKTIKAVSDDVEAMDFNTAISRMMEFVNHFTKQSERPQSTMETFILLLSPFAPHLSEELWELLGHTETLAYEPWPEFNENFLKESTIEVPVQINGKVRAKINVPAGTNKDDLLALAKSNERVAELIEGMNIVKEIAVPGRMVNFVVKG
ncbi:MAG: leucyl-tRNA synthetase [Pirellulaceae bacterium]|jgi:leucyl-tRNA synthetase